MTRVLRPGYVPLAAALLAAFTVSGVLAASDEPAKAGSQKPVEDDLRAEALAVFAKLPEAMPGSENDTPARIELGKKLYFEKAISINRTQSCNDCHRVDENLGGSDGLPTSKGAGGEFGGRNSPTVLNAGLHVAQFWDGRAVDLAEQAKGPVLNPIEMGMPDETLVLQRLVEAGYEPMFKAVFPDAQPALSYDTYAEAVAAFERTLITRDAFDDFLGGDSKALNARARQGLALFMETGCTDCHHGALLGGNEFRKMGEVEAYANTEDLGRFDVTKKDDDKFVFKVPSLRNIAITGPYFHDGKSRTLKDAVQQMARLQLGSELDDQQMTQMLAFLRTLTDKPRIPKPRQVPKAG